MVCVCACVCVHIILSGLVKHMIIIIVKVFVYVCTYFSVVGEMAQDKPSPMLFLTACFHGNRHICQGRGRGSPAVYVGRKTPTTGQSFNICLCVCLHYRYLYIWGAIDQKKKKKKINRLGIDWKSKFNELEII